MTRLKTFKSIKIIESNKSILLIRSDGIKIRYHSLWLRNNALDGKTRDKLSGQRLIKYSDIPVNTFIKSAYLDKTGKNIFIVFMPEEKKIKFSSEWLIKYSYDKKKNKEKGWINSNLKIWNKNFSKNIPKISYKIAKSNNAKLIKWLTSLLLSLTAT